MTSKLPVVDPKRVKSPVLLVRGEYDGIATMADLTEFFNELPNGDKQFIVLPGAAHSLNMAKNRHLMWHTIDAFLKMPEGASV
jgi:alpha-beta hydrolase superfamily lysophospholipase